MKEKNHLIIIIIFILFLVGATFWQFKSFSKSLSEIELPKLEIPKIEFPPPQGATGEKEFVSPDGQLRLNYSSDWTEMPKETLEYLNQETIKEGAEILFFANKSKMEKAALASLIVQKFTPEKDEGLENVIENMKEEAQEKEVEMEILNLEIQEKEAYFEAKYKRKEGTVFQSGERIILLRGEAYLIMVLSLENSWPEFKKEVEEIFNSIQIVS